MFMNNKQFPLRWAPKASSRIHPGGNLEPSQGFFPFSFPTTIYRTKTAAEKNNDPPPNPSPADHPAAETRFEYNPDDPTAAVLASFDCI